MMSKEKALKLIQRALKKMKTIKPDFSIFDREIQDWCNQHWETLVAERDAQKKIKKQNLLM